MKKMSWIIPAVLILSGVCSAEQVNLPFDLKYFGNFQKILHTKNTEGVTDLAQALAGEHVYAVGALKNAEGEITVYDGKVWLSYERDGIADSLHYLPANEQAMILATARVKAWQDVVIPSDMTEHELHQFILRQAEAGGISVRTPFPFLVEGPVRDLVWHIIDGVDSKAEGHGDHAFIKKLSARKEKGTAQLIGFYSADIQGFFTHPGESWHAHVIFPQEKKSGHVESFSAGRGAILRLPLK